MFAAIIALKYLLPQDDFGLLIDDVNKAVTELFDHTNSIQKPQLYNYMGFPENWLEIKDCKVD